MYARMSRRYAIWLLFIIYYCYCCYYSSSRRLIYNSGVEIHVHVLIWIIEHVNRDCVNTGHHVPAHSLLVCVRVCVWPVAVCERKFIIHYVRASGRWFTRVKMVKLDSRTWMYTFSRINSTSCCRLMTLFSRRAEWTHAALVCVLCRSISFYIILFAENFNDFSF